MSFTALSEGGEYYHILSADELAPHYHTANRFLVNSSGGNTVLVGSGSLRISYFEDGSVHTDQSDGGEAHNNMQPFKCCYMWRRTA